MANESFVRPAVSPNIRPAPAQPSPGADNPDKGKAHINGASGRHIDLPFSWSVSMSTSRSRETKRRFDEVRIYQMDDDQNINKDNFVDVEIANKIWMKDGEKETMFTYPSRFVGQEPENTELRRRNVIEYPPGYGS